MAVNILYLWIKPQIHRSPGLIFHSTSWQIPWYKTPTWSYRYTKNNKMLSHFGTEPHSIWHAWKLINMSFSFLITILMLISIHWESSVWSIKANGVVHVLLLYKNVFKAQLTDLYPHAFLAISCKYSISHPLWNDQILHEGKMTLKTNIYNVLGFNIISRNTLMENDIPYTCITK